MESDWTAHEDVRLRPDQRIHIRTAFLSRSRREKRMKQKTMRGEVQMTNRHNIPTRIVRLRQMLVG